MIPVSLERENTGFPGHKHITQVIALMLGSGHPWPAGASSGSSVFLLPSVTEAYVFPAPDLWSAVSLQWEMLSGDHYADFEIP